MKLVTDTDHKLTYKSHSKWSRGSTITTRRR